MLASISSSESVSVSTATSAASSMRQPGVELVPGEDGLVLEGRPARARTDRVSNRPPVPPGGTGTRCFVLLDQFRRDVVAFQLLDQALEAVAVVEQLELSTSCPPMTMSSSSGKPGMWSFRSQLVRMVSSSRPLGSQPSALRRFSPTAPFTSWRAHQRVQRAEFLEQLHGRLGPDLVDAGHVVDRVAHQGLVIHHQPRRHAELHLDAHRVAPAVVHGVDHGHVLVHQLRQVLVATGDHRDQAALGGHARERADHVVRFHAGNVQHLPSQQLHHLVDRRDLRAQVVGHGRARRLVLGIARRGRWRRARRTRRPRSRRARRAAASASC